MLRNYLKTAIRNLWRFRGYTVLNITGLAIGMATCILIFAYITHELSYDKFNADYDNVYRISVKGRMAEDFLNVAVTMPPLAAKVKADYPEINSVTRIEKLQDDIFFSYNDRNYYESGLYYVDSTFFDVFTFELARGNPHEVLKEPHSLLITESIARKYFGNEDPMGKVLRVNDQLDMVITGILRNIPDNSHLKFNMLASFTTLVDLYGKARYQDNWGSLFLHTYVRLNQNVDLPRLKEKLALSIKEAFGKEAEGFNIEMTPYLQPITSIHLHSHLLAEIEPNSDISYVNTFAAVAAFILVIACINFMNLATARSSKRNREVAMRKVCGATRGQLVGQFIGESLLMSLLAMVLALILVELALPVFQQLSGLDLGQRIHGAPTILMLLCIVLFVGIIAGSYPAFVISSFKPIQILRKELFKGISRSALRNILVVMQFSISIILLISTWLVFEQLHFIRNAKLGFDKENVIIIPLHNERLQKKAEELKKEFINLTDVMSVAVSSAVPGTSMDGIGYTPEGIDKKSPWIIYTLRGDYDMLNLFGMELAAGRNFSKDFGTDSSSVIINETLVKKLGWHEPVGKKIYQFGQENNAAYTVIGVVRDFHFKSFHDPIEPCLIMLNHDHPGYIGVRLAPGRVDKNLDELRKKWDETESAFSFDYFFLSDRLDMLYESEKKMGELFIYFTFLAILIASLGLFGLASYSAERRTKEIGIRKVHGATVANLVFRLSKEFTKWVILANVIAWPVAFILIDHWLERFAYRIDIWDYSWIFILAGILALIIALVTVGYQAFKAANSDPVRALKYE
jgi:putative ABC transport system permease protein